MLPGFRGNCSLGPFMSCRALKFLSSSCSLTDTNGNYWRFLSGALNILAPIWVVHLLMKLITSQFLHFWGPCVTPQPWRNFHLFACSLVGINILEAERISLPTIPLPGADSLTLSSSSERLYQIILPLQGYFVSGLMPLGLRSVHRFCIGTW